MDPSYSQTDLPPIAFLQAIPSSPTHEMSSKSPRKSDKQPAGPQPAPSTEKTAAPKPKPKPRQERTKGKTVLPTEQIQMIVQERGTSALSPWLHDSPLSLTRYLGHVNITSKEAVFVLSAATVSIFHLPILRQIVH